MTTAPVTAPLGISSRTMGLLAVAGGALCFGLQPISARYFLDSTPHPITLNVLRCLAEFIVGFLIYLTYERGSVLPLWRQWVTIGLLQAAFFNLHMGALLYAPVATVTVCVFTYPLLAALALQFVKRSPMGGLLFWMSVAFLGVVCAVSSSLAVSPTTPYGAGLGLGAAVLIAIYLILMGRVDTPNRFGLSACFAACSCITNTIIGAASGQLVTPTKPALIFAAITGVLGSLGTVSLLWGLHRVTTQEAALILNFEIVVTVLASYLLCGEDLSLLQVAGVALIFVSIVQGQKLRA